MIQQIVTRVSLDSFREKSAGKKVVLLYPWTNYRNLFLGHFLAHAKDGLLYYRIPENTKKLNKWVAELTAELDDVLGGFGTNLNKVVEKGSPEDIGLALAKDLSAFSKDPITLFIDELDRVAFDDKFNTFITALVNGIANNVQIAVSSRLLTYETWRQIVADGVAVVLGTEYHRNDIMFTIEDEPKPQLEVYASGRGHVLVNGKEIANWDGALPRNLFFYFIDNPLVTRDDIFRTFWPALSVKEATNVYHVTKRKISERISLKVGDEDNYELTQYSSGFYMPSNKIVRHYDMGNFQSAVERAMVTLDDKEKERLYRRAIDLYKAPFLETISMPWVEERREQLKRLYSQALVGMGRVAAKQNQHEESLGYFTRALRETPEREDVHRDVMTIYIQRGMTDDARNQYQYLKQFLKDEFRIAPCKESRELFESIS
jgi:two-component SAPR family response regulator